MTQLLGAHTSIQGGVSAAVDLAQKLKFNAMQIFTKTSNQWKGKEISDEEADKYKSKLEKSNIKFVVSHDSYLINLCSNNEELLDKSRKGFLEEIKKRRKIQPYSTR